MHPLIYFIILLGVLIFIHELGHFLFAKILGVRVLTFSIGFGPKIFKHKLKHTEYCISLFPLGGYVKMLGEDPSERVPAEDREFAFNYKPLYKRFLIVFAGPIFNILLPVLLLFIIFFKEGDVLPSMIGTVVYDSPAFNAGIKPSDRIVEIDGNKVNYWWEVTKIIENKGGEEILIKYLRDGMIKETKVVPSMYVDSKLKMIGITEKKGRIGISPAFLKPVVYVEKESPAEKAGLKEWDIVTHINGKKIEMWEELRRFLEDGSLTPFSIRVLREKYGKIRKNLEDAEFENPFTLQIYPVERNGKSHTGINSSEFFIYEVEDNTPAKDAGLKKGDEILSLNGKKYTAFDFLVEDLYKESEKVHNLEVRRDGEIINVQIKLKLKKVKSDIGVETLTPIFGAKNRSFYSMPELIPNEKRLSYAIFSTIKETFHELKVIIFGVVALVRGKVPLKELGGPILIYDIAGKSSERGWGYFFKIMIWLSINLAIINLLPIPVLDGGHIFLFSIEAIRRKPLKLRTIKIVNFIGLIFLILLMLFVFKNDIERKWGDILEYFNK